MEEGEISEWLVNVGEQFGKGKIIASEASRNSELAKKAFSIPAHKHLFDLGFHELNTGRHIATNWQMERGFERA